MIDPLDLPVGSGFKMHQLSLFPCHKRWLNEAFPRMSNAIQETDCSNSDLTSLYNKNTIQLYIHSKCHIHKYIYTSLIVLDVFTSLHRTRRLLQEVLMIKHNPLQFHCNEWITDNVTVAVKHYLKACPCVCIDISKWIKGREYSICSDYNFLVEWQTFIVLLSKLSVLLVTGFFFFFVPSFKQKWNWREGKFSLLNSENPT